MALNTLDLISIKRLLRSSNTKTEYPFGHQLEANDWTELIN